MSFPTPSHTTLTYCRYRACRACSCLTNSKNSWTRQLRRLRASELQLLLLQLLRRGRQAFAKFDRNRLDLLPGAFLGVGRLGLLRRMLNCCLLSVFVRERTLLLQAIQMDNSERVFVGNWQLQDSLRVGQGSPGLPWGSLLRDSLKAEQGSPVLSRGSLLRDRLMKDSLQGGKRREDRRWRVGKLLVGMQQGVESRAASRLDQAPGLSGLDDV